MYTGAAGERSSEMRAKPMGKTILHVDMDAFFASVEQRERPELAGRPVIVGADPREGRGRGVVAACSYEARRFGVHSALPISQAYRRCPQAVYLRPNGRLYQAVSHQVMTILGRFSDLVEPISIDEAFLDVTGSQRLFGTPVQIAKIIKETIQREERLTCSIGLAPNKFLAKVASDLNKPDGLTLVEPGREAEFLAPLGVRRIWGVGAKTEARLKSLGVRTIGDVARKPLQFWIDRLGRHGVHLWELSHGRDRRQVEPRGAFKSLSHESTFAEDTQDLERIRATLLALSEAVALRLRKNGVRGRNVTLKWRWADFTTLTRQTTLGQATDDAQSVYRACSELLSKLLPLRQRVRLVGVAVGRLEGAGQKQQPGLFDENSRRKRRLDQSVDAILEKFGQTSIKKASLLDDPYDEDDRFSSFLKH